LESLATIFAGYRAAIIPAEAPAVQVEECRRAFYSAAFALLTTFALIGTDEISEDAGVAHLDGLMKECDAFIADLKAHPDPASFPRVPEPPQYTVPDPDEIAPILRALGKGIGSELPAGYGFLLMLFTFGEGGSNFYISNADRADILRMLREFIARQTQ